MREVVSTMAKGLFFTSSLLAVVHMLAKNPDWLAAAFFILSATVAVDYCIIRRRKREETIRALEEYMKQAKKSDE